MNTYFLFGSIGVLVLFIITGLVCGLVRGLKRSSLHIIFMLVSVVVALVSTKYITNLVLGIKISFEAGTEAITINDYIVKIIQEQFDLSNYSTLTSFIERFPSALVAPIVFMVLTLISYFIFDIIYLIIARISFGKKRVDFKEHKPRRWLGALVGICEAFLFMFILFAPVTSLTNTYQEIAQLSNGEVTTAETAETESKRMLTVGEYLSQNLPSVVGEVINAYNNSVIGKISGAGGLNNAMFDYLSNFDLNGEKIEFRQELVSVTKIYDNFAETYNNILDKKFDEVDIKTLKVNIEKFLNNGMFKTVVSDTVKDVVLNIDSLNTEGLPEVVKDVVTELKTAFSVENFDIYAYLKHDILEFIDVIDTVFEDELVSKISDLEEINLENILNIVDTNSESVKEIAKKFLELNFVEDSFNALGKFVSTKMETMFENEKGLEFGFNTNITDKNQMVDDIMSVVEDFIDLNQEIDISNILKTNDFIDALSEIDNIEQVLQTMGTTFDKLKNLNIFVLPITETRLEKVYVFDNILKYYNIDILGDEVVVNIMDPQTTTLDTYTKFFNYIKSSVKVADDLGLLELGKEGVNFDTILDNILVALQVPQNEDLFAKILIPFYQLDEASFNTTTTDNSLKALIFDNVISEIGNNVDILNFSGVTDNLTSWYTELSNLGQILNKLNQGQVGSNNKSYIKYMLENDADLTVVLKDMTSVDGRIKEILSPIVSSKIFDNLTTQIFQKFDTAVGDITKVAPTTDLTNLERTKDNTLAAIEQLAKIVLNQEDGVDFTLDQFGEILDILKGNAYNEGTKDGVLNEIFANIIWYMTGDDITGTGKFASGEKNENAGDIKAYLEIADTNNFEGYYTVESYAEVMAEIKDVVDFATTLNNNINGITLSDETIGNYVSGIKSALDDLDGKTETEKAKVVNNLKKIIDGNAERTDILTPEDKTNYSVKIVNAIDSAESGISTEVGTALKNLLDIV